MLERPARKKDSYISTDKNLFSSFQLKELQKAFKRKSTQKYLLSAATMKYIKKGKAVSLQSWSGPEGSRMLRFPDYMTTAQDGGKVVSLMHRPPLPPGSAPGTHFC
jgi:hypothetical protein